MKWKINISRKIKITLGAAVLCFLIAFSERKQEGTSIQNVVIRVDNIHENHFLDEGDVAALMQLNHETIRGASLTSVNLKAMEKKIKSNRFIQDAELYSDLKGNLVVHVTLRRPIARIVQNDGPDGYIAEDGTVMPVSEKFTTRVVLISGSFVKYLLQQENLNASEEGKNLMAMLYGLREDDFWSAQIAQLDIDLKAKITVYPQVGGQLVEFGTAENFEMKFKKLKIFYKEILPYVGWNRYKRVNLEYEGQIVAE